MPMLLLVYNLTIYMAGKDDDGANKCLCKTCECIVHQKLDLTGGNPKVTFVDNELKDSQWNKFSDDGSFGHQTGSGLYTHELVTVSPQNLIKLVESRYKKMIICLAKGSKVFRQGKSPTREEVGQNVSPGYNKPYVLKADFIFECESSAGVYFGFKLIKRCLVNVKHNTKLRLGHNSEEYFLSCPQTAYIKCGQIIPIDCTEIVYPRKQVWVEIETIDRWSLRSIHGKTLVIGPIDEQGPNNSRCEIDISGWSFSGTHITGEIATGGEFTTMPVFKYLRIAPYQD